MSRPLHRLKVRIPLFPSTTRLSSLWDRLRTSFWFLPSVMAAAAITLSFALVQIDSWLGVEIVRDFGWLYLAVGFGVLLAIASLAVLIYFIHHIATSIRIETLLAQLAAETRAAIDRLYPEQLGHDPPSREDRTPEHLLPADFECAALRVRAERSGYVQRVDVEALMRLATEHDLLVRVEARPGRFVTERDAVLTTYPSDRVADGVVDRLRGTLVIGQDRTPEQDLEFSIGRIVEIAQRALSPGINDPTTARYCIDRLGEAFGRMAGRDLPSPLRFDDTSRLRIITEVISLDELACPAFAAVARYGIKDADVVERLLCTMDRLLRAARPEVRVAISQLSGAIRRESQEGLREFDRRGVHDPAR